MSQRVGTAERHVRVLLVDDDERVRGALRTLFETHSDLRVVGEAGNSAEAVAAVARLDPDVVLMDCRMAEELDGVAATREIKGRLRKVPRVVLLTMGPELKGPARDSGVDEFLVKGCSSERLLDALRGGSPASTARAGPTTRRREGE